MIHDNNSEHHRLTNIIRSDSDMFKCLVFVCVSSGLVIAMVVSLIFIILLRFLAGVMIWIMIFMVILVIGYGKSSSSLNNPVAFFF